MSECSPDCLLNHNPGAAFFEGIVFKNQEEFERKMLEARAEERKRKWQNMQKYLPRKKK